MLHEVTVLLSDDEHTALEAGRAEMNARLKTKNQGALDTGQYVRALLLHGLKSQAVMTQMEEAKARRVQPVHPAILGPGGRPIAR